MRSAPTRSAPPRAPDSSRCWPAGGASSSDSAGRPSVLREAPNYPDLRVDALALALAPRVGARRYREQAEGFGSAAHAFAATVGAGAQARLRDDARRVIADGDRCGARLILFDDREYPAPLRELYDPPPFLFVIGDVAVLERPAVAIVGTRRATAYGERATTAIAGALAAAGACVVSGMARGIDSVAHRAALACRGATVAVLGTGVDVVYPVAHRTLHRTIGERGLLVSEFPCGARPTRGSFPRRNRIIAALARLTIVVEAGEGSGALLTADFAADLGRDVAAVPGPIDAPQSARANALIRDGAHAVLGPAHALQLMGYPIDGSRRSAAGPTLSHDEQRVWAALADGALPVDSLIERAVLPPNRALAALTSLELAGLVEATVSGDLRRCAR